MLAAHCAPICCGRFGSALTLEYLASSVQPAQLPHLVKSRRPICNQSASPLLIATPLFHLTCMQVLDVSQFIFQVLSDIRAALTSLVLIHGSSSSASHKAVGPTCSMAPSLTSPLIIDTCSDVHVDLCPTRCKIMSDRKPEELQDHEKSTCSFQPIGSYQLLPQLR